ncbi:MAG: right-handed parallel beta-helix repeat-containing protein [Planctomycetota bacterium]|jgi:hypothetical protein
MSWYCRFLIVAGLGVFSTAHADTIYVDDDNCPGPGDGTGLNPYCSIQTAIDHAVDGDEIIVAPGTYFETIDYLGRAVALRGSDGPAVTTIDAGGTGTVVQCVAGEGPGTVLEGFTITGGSAASGAGMRNAASEPTVVDCVFVDNHATALGAGGAMFNTSASTVTVVDTAFVGNTAVVGAGVFSEVLSNLSMIGCTFRENSSAVGSAINARDLGQITVTDTRFVDNGENGVGGGGIAAFDCEVTIVGCVFTGNESAGGAGIVAGDGTLTVRDSVFVDNAASYAGGAIYELNLSTSIVNCLFSSNEGGFGGGVFTSTEAFSLVNCTFVNNFGAGLTEEVPSVPVLQNCVFWGNTPAQLDTEPPGSPAAVSVFFCDVQGGFSGPGSNNIDADPLFVGGPSGAWTAAGTFDPVTGESTFTDADASFAPGELAGKLLVPLTLVDVERPIVANSATTITVLGDVATWGIPGQDYRVNDYRLSADSFCVDAADNTAVPDGITKDLDGKPRFVDDPATVDTGFGDPPLVDIGAYEFQGMPCPWDLDGDGSVFVTDLLLLLAGWGPCADCPADFNADGLVNVVDLLALIGNFGPCPGSPCVWDVNGDGVVDNTDLQQVLDNFGLCAGCPEDVNGDGTVNGQDAAAVATHFGPCP